MDRQHFKELVWDYYAKHGRDLPWRHEPFDAYSILVSEVMLQQTQVQRVIPKYLTFLKQFPTIHALARAPLADVIRAWSGLGYNRRAKYLHEAAKVLVSKAELWHPEDLTACKGIGDNTAAAVLAYAYDQPIGFIETNIRTVYIHHFFADTSEPITDRQLEPLIWDTVDLEHPREWFWALMDYGSFLKATEGNAARLSKHHIKQSRFEGSKRQIRGQVLRLLADQTLPKTNLEQSIPDDRLDDVLEQLVHEGLIQHSPQGYGLAH